MSAMRSTRAFVLPIVIAVASAACNEEGAIQVKKLSFAGVQAVDEGRLRGALATRENAKIPLVGVALPWGRKYFFDRARFDADLKRIQAFYADRGYPDARVTNFDVKLNDKQDAVEIAVTIDEGEPARIASVNLIGFDVVPPKDFARLENRLPLKEGDPRDRQLVVGAHELALNELRNHGYPYARVQTDEHAGATAGQLIIDFTAEPGVLAHFGEIEISGNASVGEDVIRRELGYRPGDLYRRRVVQDTQRSLYAMELFQFVNIETLNPDRREPQVRTRVTVAEGNHQRVNFGVGYGTEEKARVEGEYHHVNFLGGARSAGAHARWSSLDRGIRVDFNQPNFFRPPLSVGVEGQNWYTYTPAYRSVVSGADLTVANRSSARTTWSVSTGSQHISSRISNEALNDPTLRNDLIALGLDPTTGVQEGALTTVGADFQRSTADNQLNARRGYQLALHAETAGRMLPGTFNYHAVSLDGRHYAPFGARLTLATRLQIGDINPAADEPSNVPFSKKYFLGGSTSIRGWGRYEVSPLSGSGLPIGGNSMLAFSSELRAALAGSIGGVLFLDAGNVWADDWSIDFGELRYAAGGGLRYQTPVGPIRLDLGYQLNPIEGLLINGEEQKRRWRIHFSIGQAF